MKLLSRSALSGLALPLFLFLLAASPAAACRSAAAAIPPSTPWERTSTPRGRIPGRSRLGAVRQGAGDLPRKRWPFDTKRSGGDSRQGSGRGEPLTTAFSYTFGERVIGVARIPWSSRPASSGEGEGASTTRDLADPEVYALARLWSSEFAPGLGRRAWLSALGGVKTDWGKDDLAADGERLDEHLQPGTGSTDVFGGLSGLYLLDTRSSLFASVQRRWTGSNAFDYEYGT